MACHGVALIGPRWLPGLLFVLLGLAFVVNGVTAWNLNVLWVLPVLALGLGVVGVIRALLRSRHSGEPALPVTRSGTQSLCRASGKTSYCGSVSGHRWNPLV